MRRAPLLPVAGLVLLAFTVLSIAPPDADAARRKKRAWTGVGLLLDGTWSRNDEVTQLLTGEVKALTEGEFDVRFDKVLVADFRAKTINAHLDQLFADPEVDIVITLGPLSSHLVAKRADLPKPVIAPLVIDPELQGLPMKRGASGRRNLSYLVWSWAPPRDLKAFAEIVPFEKLTILSAPYYGEVMPGFGAALAKLPQVAKGYSVVAVGSSADKALAEIPPDSDAVYVGPLLHLPEAELQKLIDGLGDRRLPSFSMLGRRMVQMGVLASVAPEEDFPRLARRVAINLQRILLGEDPREMSVDFKREERLTINMSTARRIGFYPSWDVLTEADLLKSERKSVDRKLNLLTAVKAALSANADLQAADQAVVVGAEEIALARANLLPRVDLGLTAGFIDRDRARASLGQAAERQMGVELGVTQVIYSERAWANMDIQKHLHRGREAERNVSRLDVIFEATSAYLNVLRAKTLETIQKDNLTRTRQNLELARLRNRIGASGPAEVYRWESQIANDRKAVISANSQRNIAEMQLNRVLRRPLEEPFVTEETALDDPFLITSDPRLFRALRDPWSFKVFRRLMVEMSLERSPDLDQLDEAIKAQRRAIVSNKRRLWAPEIGLSFTLSHQLYAGGEGSEGTIELPPTIPLTFPEADDTDWTLGLKLSLPLFEGTARYAEIRKAQAELRRLRLLREAASERIEQRVRSELHRAGASYPAIKLSRDAAEAAQKNLDLVTQAYSRGAVSIIELIDAQNAALVADEVAASSVYDFLVDLMAVHRALGSFFILLDDERREEFLQILDTRLDQESAPPAATPEPKGPAQ